MFLWVFRATVWPTELLGTIPPLRGWDGPALLAWANPTRAAKPSFPLGRDCMLLRHGEVSILPYERQICMNIESAWWISWLLKQNRDPTWYYTYPIVVQLYFHAPIFWFAWYDQYPDICDHVVRINMQRVLLVVGSVITATVLSFLFITRWQMLVDVSRIAGSTVRSSIIAHTVITCDYIPLLPNQLMST